MNQRKVIKLEDYHVRLLTSWDSIDNKHNTNSINLFWWPNPPIIKALVALCQKRGHTRILEVGPGSVPFPLATEFVGFHESFMDKAGYHDININTTRLPFSDKAFDFLYARHVLEDVQNPDFALREMFRVSKSVYIETPSPLIEMMRYIDAERDDALVNQMRGYMHHRYLVWSDQATIYFLPKLPLIECVALDPDLEARFRQIANQFPVYWNNYYLVEERDFQPEIVMVSDDLHIYRDYLTTILQGIETSLNNTNRFVVEKIEPHL